MPASEAQILANRQNALRSTGPKTPEGKEASRANSYKHGLTGAGVVMAEGEADEVERRYHAFREELHATGEVGRALARHAATMSVRMERCAAQEVAATIERVRRAEAEFETPEGVDEATADQLRAEAGKIALFDPSREAGLARQYEARAVAGFFRAVKELRLREKANAVDPVEAAIEDQAYRMALASISQVAKPAPARPAEPPTVSRNRIESTFLDDLTPSNGRVDVAFAVGRRC